eukprot:8435416-Pyramimonas_sp.AAC.1
MVQEVAPSQDPSTEPKFELHPDILASAPDEVQQMVASPCFIKFQELLRAQHKVKQEASGPAPATPTAPPSPATEGGGASHQSIP